ncbi:MAG: type II toxin-antitoxin system RelE/ParE family toxin [Deltaproteobacteria bacterium]|nr:type II toxin-antitoxin system RelE/ParE family toxin [Deltaproteobacteria bacterium]
MAHYSVTFKPSVEKDFRALPKAVAHRVWAAIEKLAEEPLPRGALKLTGSESLYRLRIGDYRLIYGVDNEKSQVLIHHIRHRREVYRQF